MNSSPAELAVDPSNMKEQKLQTKGICYPEPAFFFFFYVSCKSSRTKIAFIVKIHVTKCPSSNITKLHTEVCKCSVGLLAERLFPIKTIWFGNDASALFDEIWYSDFPLCVRLRGAGYRPPAKLAICW